MLLDHGKTVQGEQRCGGRQCVNHPDRATDAKGSEYSVGSSMSVTNPCVASQSPHHRNTRRGRQLPSCAPPLVSGELLLMAPPTP